MSMFEYCTNLSTLQRHSSCIPKYLSTGKEQPGHIFVHIVNLLIYSIDIECVTMNAHLEVNKRHKGSELSFEEIVCYGKRAARIFRRETGNDTALLFSKEYQASMIECYAQYLEVETYLDRGTFQLKAEAPITEIQEFFRWSLDDGLLNALLSPEAVDELEV